MEFLDNIGGLGIDLEIAKTLQRSLTKQGTNTVFDLSTIYIMHPYILYRNLAIEKVCFLKYPFST